MALRDASELLWPAVSVTLTQLDLTDEHAAAKKLAQRYAQIIDQANDQEWAARWLMPLMLDALTALGATPVAQAAIAKRGGPGADAEDPLSKLRARRRGA